MLGKIVESGLKSFYKENTLLDQAFVYEPSKTIAQLLKELGTKVGKPVQLTHFVRYALGEGITREETDFAAEVAAPVGNRQEARRRRRRALTARAVPAASCMTGICVTGMRID